MYQQQTVPAKPTAPSYDYAIYRAKSQINAAQNQKCFGLKDLPLAGVALA